MSLNKRHSGVIVPMVSPLTAGLTIDEGAVGRIMERFVSAGVSVFAGGTTGEAASISMEEKIRLTELVISMRSGNTRVYAGIAGNCLKECIDLGQAFASLGTTALVAHLPYYYPSSESAMESWFEKIAAEVDCPLIIYNHPGLVGQSIPLELADNLSRHPNIEGFKDSERDEKRMERALELWKDRENFDYLPGWAAKSAHALLRGASGIVPSTANFTPGLYRKLYDAAISGREEMALELQELSNALSLIYQEGRHISTSIPALKILMHVSGLCQAHVMPPMEIPETEEQDRLHSIFTKLMNSKDAGKYE